jgi:hypothetical protein
MKWILYLMLFTTPAANVTEKAEQTCLSHKTVRELTSIFACRPEFEGKRIWSLQSTSQLDFSNLESCVKTQDQLIANSNVASTMTLRTWCFCDSDAAKCPTVALAEEAIGAIRNCEIKPDDTACQDNRKKFNNFVGPDPTTGFGGGRNSTSVQLYPPPPKRP